MHANENSYETDVYCVKVTQANIALDNA